MDRHPDRRPDGSRAPVAPIEGDVTASRAGQARPLAVGQRVHDDDVVATGGGRVAIQLDKNHVVWRLGPQPVDGVEGALDLNFFVVENAAGVPDEFEITTTVVDAGLYQRLLAEQLGGRLNSRPRGQETIPDGWVRAGTFVPFSVEDH